MKYWLLGGSLWLSLLVACEGVGRGLVDHRSSKTSANARCAEPQPCTPEPRTLPVPSEPGDFGDFALCDPQPSPILRDDFPRENCFCKNYAVRVRESSTTPIVLDTGSFRHCRLSLSAERPSTLALQRVLLDDVAITLNGPIDLRLSEAQFSRVRVRGNSTSAGDPSLSLEASRGSMFALANDQDTPTELRVSHSVLEDSFLRASSMHFESSALRGSTVSSEDFESSDLTVGLSLLRLDHALFSASSLNGVTVESCGRVRLVGGELVRVEIASCREPLQLYSMRVQNSLLNGALELDDADISSSRVGVTQATSLLSYNSRLVSVTLCDRVGGAQLSGGLLDCVSCEGPLAEGEGHACSAGQPLAMDPDENPCPALANVSICESFPPHRRQN